MSGIVVVIGEGADRYTFGRMMYALARRGDGPETLLRNGLLAGTQRSREPGRPESRQPWCSPDGELLICFDGELTDPGRLAVAPAGAGDAEVALAAFRRWGDAAVTRLRGEYALVIVQRATRRAYLARDPMGVRPLYWSVHDTELHVASEVKALVPADVRIHEVPPGHHGWAAKGRPPELRAFFEAPELSLGRAPVTGPYTAATQLRAGLRDAVTGGLPATGRVGVLLSGGIDSAAVLAAVRELAPDCVAFTAGTPDSPDVVGARRLADRLGVAHEVIELRPEDIGYDQVREAVRTGELTEYGDIANAIVTLPLLRRVRERGIRVVFTGDGADELFGGYPGYHGITPEKVRQLFRSKLANLGRADLHRLDRV
ncbi:MAG TPA: asparagine synthetase B, partial [Rugosimonospora sp.]|nr:asparagine synthetase B [Rugosimonospora sp.]